MKDLPEKLSFFHKLICSNYPMSLWSYDPSFSLTNTTNPDLSLLIEMDVAGVLRHHLKEGSFAPVICNSNIGIIWIAGFAHREGQLTGIHLLGPALTGRESGYRLLQKMDEHDLTLHSRRIISEIVSQMPIIPTNTMVNYAVMLHYVLNEEIIPLSSVAFSTQGAGNAPREKLQAEEHLGIWENEQRLCKLFEEGDPEIENAVLSGLSLSSGLKVSTGENLRKHKNNALVLLTLCSRACIRGGLLPSVAYDLNDYYAGLIEECRTQGEVVKLCVELANDYASRVRLTKEMRDISPAVQNACHYIQRHLTEEISIDNLARRAGYSEYYFSHKFQKETGHSVKEFILNEKIIRAKTLLSGGRLSIQEISDELNFSNRSYFSTCFQKAVGLSPSEYKKMYAKC